MLLRSLNLIRRTVLSIALLILILAALVASLGRYFVPYLSDYREPVLAWLNQSAPFEIAAAEITGDWHRLSPTIAVRDLHLGPKATGLHVDRAAVTLNLAYSLWQGKLVFDQLHFSGTTIDLLEAENGQWALQADWLPKNRPPTKPVSVEALYSGLDRFIVKAARLNLHRSNGKLIVVDHLNVDYTKQGNEWRIRSDGLPDKSPLPLNMVVEGIGLPQHENFSARAYTLINGFDVSPYLSRASYRGWTPELPRFDGKLWLDFHRGGRVLLQGVLDLQDIRFNHDDGRQSIDIPELKTQFKFALGEGNKPSVWLRDLSITLNDEVVTFEQANLLPSEDGLLASFDSIEVNPVLHLLRRFEVLPDQAQEALTILDPGGELHDITLFIPEGAKLADMQVAAGLRNVSVKPWKGAPGVENLSGQIFAQTKRGVVEINSQNLAMRFPKLYHQPLSFADSAGPIEWVIKEKIFEVRSGKIELAGKLGQASAFLKLEIPLKKEYNLEPEMDLQIALENSKGRFRDKFIPYILDQKLQDWIERSIVSADVNEAAFIYRGSLAKNSNLRKTIQLYIDSSNADIDYDPAWPAARDVTAKVFIDDNNVLGEASKGEISGLALGNARIRYVPRSRGPGGKIRISSKISGEVSKGLEFILDSPIKDKLGGALDDWYAAGKLSGSVRASIPIGFESPEDVQLRARLHSAELGDDRLNLAFRDLNGPLRYSSLKGLHSAGIVGTFWDDSMAATIVSRQTPKSETAPANWLTEINVKGSSKGAAVFDWLKIPLRDFVDGEFEYTAKLSLGGGDSQLRMNTKFEGMSSRLPAPFAKEADQLMLTEVRMFLDDDPLRLRIQIAEHTKAALVLHKDSPITGTVSFGARQQPSYAKDSIRLIGSIEAFDLASTLEVVEAISNDDGESGSEGEGQTLPTVYAQNLLLKKASAFGNEFNNLTTAVASHGRAWTFAVSGKDVAGRATYDAERSLALDISLDHLYLQTETNELELPTEEAANTDILADWYPSDLPEMQFKLADLKVNGEPYGRWSFETSKIQHGVIFRNLDASSRGLQIAGTPEQPAFLRWKRVGDQQQTEFNGVLSCSDLGAVLEAWEYAAAMRSKSCRFGAELSWYGSPLDLELAQMEGRVDIALNNGQFLETNSTANALRIFSLFNFDTLLRRLQFRFDDVFNRGLSYDQISGEFLLTNGMLNIQKPFDVKGPSSRLQMTGSLDLVNETVDTRMVATLPISSNLPWVAALAGGLPMAAGVYVAGKIFQKPMEKLSSASYEVTGSWDDPTIKLQRIFDDDARKASGSVTAEPESAVPQSASDPAAFQ